MGLQPKQLKLNAKGDMIVRTSTGTMTLPVGADGTSLRADSASSEGVKWVTDADSDLGKAFLQAQMQSTPNQIVKIYGDGGATARGMTFSEDRDVLRLRLSFRIDQGSNYDIQCKLFKWDDGTSSVIELATLFQDDGTTASTNQYFALEQFVSAGANPGEKTIEAGDAIFVILEDGSSSAVNKCSQISVLIEHEKK